MVKTTTVNIGGTLFNINDDAYIALEDFFYKIKAHYSSFPDNKEILNDIENRMAELLSARVGKHHIITLDDVNYAISVIGKPKDFGFYQNSQSNPRSGFQQNRNRRLYRNPDNRVLGGVCSGLGAYFDIDPVLVRIIFVVLFFVGLGPLFYIIMWIIIPKACTPYQKQEMYGCA